MIVCHLAGESSSGVLVGLNWCISTVATLFFSAISIPYQFLVEILSILSSVVSLYSGFRSDPHEPLQRRISQLEDEVDKLKPLQEILPKHTDPVVDPAQKLSVLETELANTRKVGSNLIGSTTNKTMLRTEIQPFILILELI